MAEPNLRNRVACPECLAPIGEPCHGASGPDMSHTFVMKRGHRARMEADRDQRGQEDGLS